MKYILPLFIALFFTACNDSNENTHAITETNVTTIETNSTQTVAQTNTTVATAKVTPIEISGEAIFNKCKSCHGSSAENKALGSSAVIRGWEVSKIEDALKGYQNGTYGRAMKNIMAAQAKGLSDEEIKKVATYIHSL